MSAQPERPSQASTIGNDSTPYQLDHQIGYLLRLANQKHVEIFSEHINQLTPTQFSILVRLRQVGEISQNELGRSVRLDSATTNGVIDRLLKKTLISSEPDSKDRRRRIISLTPLGVETIDATLPKAKCVTAKTLTALTHHEAEQLVKLLSKLQR